jgi:hypothetical protein
MGAAMLIGALVGFAIGVVLGVGSAPAMSPLVVFPLVCATAGVALAWLPFAYGEGTRRRRQRVELDRAHDRIRAAAHSGWIEDVDLSVVTARRADGASARRTPPA